MDILNLVEEGRIQRLFRARNKISYPGCISHITQHSVGTEALFREEGDYLYILHLLKKQSKKFGYEIFSYSLMTNHLHLLIRLSKDNLSEAMKELFRTYSRFINKKYKRRGHLFASAYRQALCFSESYILAASLYIDLNAVRAKLVPYPEEYRWSSCNLYVNPFHKKTFINYTYILELLENNIQDAQKSYKEMLYSAIKVKVPEIIEKSEALEFFKISIFDLLRKAFNRIDKNGQKDLQEEWQLDNEIAELKSWIGLEKRLRNRQKFNARKALIARLKARGYSTRMISEIFGISRQALY